MSKRYWCELAWLGGPEVSSGVVLEITAGRIDAVTAGVVSAPRDNTALAGLTIPALANAHSHAFHRALRGRTQNQQGTFWTWRDLMYQTAAKLNPDNYFRLARATFAEMALAGIGVVGEFHYLHHQPGGAAYDDRNAMGLALLAAANEVGIRLTLLDTLYLHGGINSDPPYRYLPLRPEQVRFSDLDVHDWIERVDKLTAAATNSTSKVGAALHSVRAVDPPSIETVAAWTQPNDAPLHVHVSEQLAENQQCLATHGLTPTALLKQAGSLGPNVTLVHATHASDRDIELIADSGAQCCLCPTTERDLADGVGPAAALADAGVRLCVGSDSHAVIDVFEETRAVELDQRVTTLKRGVFSPESLAKMATANGYRALGWSNGGTLSPGSLADFATVSLDSVRLAGTRREHALSSMVFAATSADVNHLVVAGKPVVINGQHTSIDVASELSEAIAELNTPISELSAL